MARPFVLGVDAGGSHTRAAALALDGSAIGFGQARGGSPTHNDDAAANVALAVNAALDDAGAEPGQVIAATAGMAGVESAADIGWATGFFTPIGLTCELAIANDAVVAQAGASALSP